MFAEDISEDFSDLTFTGFDSISGYLRNLRGRLLSSEKFSEVFALWVFTLKPFSEDDPIRCFVCLRDQLLRPTKPLSEASIRRVPTLSQYKKILVDVSDIF